MNTRQILATISMLMLAGLLMSACQPLPTPAPLAPPQPTSTPAPTATPTPLPPREIHLRADEMTSKALEGNLLGDSTTRRFYVLLPPDYFYSDKRYPVVYVLPWGPGYAGGGFDGFEARMKELSTTQPDKEMILVSPDASNALGASLFRSSMTIGDYETYITQELVDYVDSHYRTLPTRESRALAGCSNGGDGAMRLALKYPDVYAVTAPTGGLYAEAPEKNSILLKELEAMKDLPEVPIAVSGMNTLRPLTAWYIQTAAGVAANPDTPSLYLDMPFRIVDGKAEIVPEVSAKITAADSAHLARQYLEQPHRLNGILIQHALRDSYIPNDQVQAFAALLTELAIAHEYVEKDVTHCAGEWEKLTVEFVADKLAFETAEASASSHESRKVLIIPRERSYDLEYMLTNELEVMIRMLTDTGFEVVVATESGKPMANSEITFEPDMALADVDTEEYAGVIFACMAAGLPGHIPSEAVEIAKIAVAEGKPVAAQYGAVNILAEAGALDEKSYAYEYERFQEGHYIGTDVVQDGTIITSGTCPYIAKHRGRQDGTQELTAKVIQSLK